MVITSNAPKEQSTTSFNNGNMMLYNNNNAATARISNGTEGGVLTTCNTTTTLEQYRLQLYNYALNLERLRAPPYTAAAMAASAAYASTTTVSTGTVNCPSVHATNYTTTGQGPSLPPPNSYLCATTAGSLIAATTHLGQTPSSLTHCPNNNRLALASMSLFPQRIFQPEEPKPQHSYIGLIAMAILNSTDTKLVLSDIYQYILENYPYFRTRGPGWRNSIRHNLSLNDCFVKSGRSANGKGHYWAIHPANIEDFRKGDFRRRKAQRKVRKHMGLEIDDNGTDSPSPPPAMDLTSPSSQTFQHIVMGSSTITAAQHLAAQSFGWRFTHQHNRQHAQHHATNGTTASYVGQIFSYRPHYAAFCSNNDVQQHHLQNHPQQLMPSTTLNQQPTIETNLIEPITMCDSQSANYGQSNAINELFSQKRKRQFDVASLLAPDQSNKRKLSQQQQQQQQYIRKQASVIEMGDVALSTPFNDDHLDDHHHQHANELDIEDIDVVEAGEENDNLDNDYEHDDHHDGADSNSNSQSRTHSNSHSQNDDDDDAEYVQQFTNEQRLTLKSNHCKITKVNITVDETILSVHDFEPGDAGDEFEEESNEHSRDFKTDNGYEEKKSNYSNNNNNNNQDYTSITTNDKINTLLLNVSNSHAIMPMITASSPIQLASNKLLEPTNDFQHSQLSSYKPPSMNTEAHNLFGRYYGTYMAAAAAASINSSLPSVNTVGNTE